MKTFVFAFVSSVLMVSSLPSVSFASASTTHPLTTSQSTVSEGPKEMDLKLPAPLPPMERVRERVTPEIRSGTVRGL